MKRIIYVVAVPMVMSKTLEVFAELSINMLASFGIDIDAKSREFWETPFGRGVVAYARHFGGRRVKDGKFDLEGGLTYMQGPDIPGSLVASPVQHDKASEFQDSGLSTLIIKSADKIYIERHALAETNLKQMSHEAAIGLVLGYAAATERVINPKIRP
jgi:hypothetical protein